MKGMRVHALPVMKPEGKGGAQKKETVKIDFSKVEIEPLFEEFVDFDTFSKSDVRAVKIKNCEEVPKSDKLLKFTLNDGTGEDRGRFPLSSIYCQLKTIVVNLEN